jgi:hypothetical protein
MKDDGDIPFSRPLAVDAIPQEGREVRIAANEGERGAIARLFGVPNVSELGARFHLTRQQNGVHVEGIVRGRVTQTCVVSLEEFDSDICESVALDFSEKLRDVTSDAVELRLDASDPPEPIVNGLIDLGAIATEFLALGLDTYPRKPGIEFVGHAEDVQVAKPFAGLGEMLKDKKRN